MTVATPGVPPNYEAVARQWTPFIYKIVIRSGIPYAEAEDVKQDILADFVAKDALSYFDPRIAPFPAFLRDFTVRRCHRARRDYMKRLRAPLLLDRPVNDEEETTYVEAFIGHDDPLIDWIFEKSQLDSFLRFLEDTTAVSVSHRVPFPDLHALLVEVTVMVLQDGEALHRWALAETLDVPRYRLDAMLVALRRVAGAYGFGEPS